jgi:hypothetical protein
MYFRPDSGTVLAAGVPGLHAGDVSDRMADGIDRTCLAGRQVERNTRRLRDADEISFS